MVTHGTPSHTVLYEVDELGQHHVDAGLGEELGVLGELLAVGVVAHELDVGAGQVVEHAEAGRRHPAGHVGLGVHRVPRPDRDLPAGPRVLPPALAEPHGSEAGLRRPEVVAGDDVGAHAEVVLVDLLDDVGRVQVGGRGPGPELVALRAEQDLDAPALELRPGPAVHEQHVARLEPRRHAACGHARPSFLRALRPGAAGCRGG
jgi:hypothetical protein